MTESLCTSDTGAISSSHHEVVPISSSYNVVLLWQLESLCTSDTGTISSSDALNLTDQLDRQKRVSKVEAEKFFGRLEREKWLAVCCNSFLQHIFEFNSSLIIQITQTQFSPDYPYPDLWCIQLWKLRGCGGSNFSCCRNVTENFSELLMVV